MNYYKLKAAHDVEPLVSWPDVGIKYLRAAAAVD
jgi:hypothetical protein